MRTTLLILFVTISNFANSQNLTFEQVQNLRKKNLVEVEIFLTSKSWRMTEAEEASDNKMAVAIFGYNVDKFDSEKAVAWIRFYESSNSNYNNRIFIQINKPTLYSTFLSRLAPNGYRLKSSKIIDGGIEKTYANTTTTCIITTTTSEGAYTKNTTYTFFFIDNLSYMLNFEED